MKILDLLEDTIPTRQNININRHFDGNRDVDERNKLGMGHFSVVRPDRDPTRVKKYNHNFATKDPFNAYIDFVIDHNATDNPYFPKIFNIKTVSDPKGYQSHKYTMERLTPGSNIDARQIEDMVKRTLAPQIADQIIIKAKDPEEIHFYRNSEAWTLHSLFSKFLNQSLYNNSNEGIKDPNLKSALNLIRELDETDDEISFDMQNPTNLMYRINGNSIQPVITDPLA